LHVITIIKKRDHWFEEERKRIFGRVYRETREERKVIIMSKIK
jgi:REP element-mobilizing transposase RayT